jgi:hypothetical protein
MFPHRHNTLQQTCTYAYYLHVFLDILPQKKSRSCKVWCYMETVLLVAGYSHGVPSYKAFHALRQLYDPLCVSEF